MKRIERVKQILSIIAMVIAIMGTVTFSMFIVEEAFQTAMFGSWAAKDANDWPLALDGADLMRVTNKLLIAMVYSIGWVQPLAFLSYRSYSKAADYYIKTLDSEIFAHEPILFVGRVVTVSIKPQRIEMLANGLVKLHAQRFYALLNKARGPFVAGRSVSITGSVSLVSNQVVIIDR